VTNVAKVYCADRFYDGRGKTFPDCDISAEIKFGHCENQIRPPGVKPGQYPPGHTRPGAFRLKNLKNIKPQRVDQGENGQPRVRRTCTAPAMRDQAAIREV
jgi:hypothetical protein